MTIDFSEKTILITGGTGTLGRFLLQSLLSQFHEIKRIIVFSRDELKQFEESRRFSAYSHKLIWKLGDVRDLNRLKQVCKNVDYIFHLAALKQVPSCELNPDESIQTNIIGTQNLIRVAEENGVKKLIGVSTDKAVEPVNTYGATKLLMEKLIIAADREIESCRFTVVRFGNFAASRGSVIPLFLRQKQADEKLTVTDPSMTRFCIEETEAANSLINVLGLMKGGEIFVPKMKSYRIGDIASIISTPSHWKMTGIRTGERMHEELISKHEPGVLFESDNSWVILPYLPAHRLAYYKEYFPIMVERENFTYRSDRNNQWYEKDDLKELIWGKKELFFTNDGCSSIPATSATTTETTATEASKTTTSSSSKTTAKTTTPVSGLSSSSRIGSIRPEHRSTT